MLVIPLDTKLEDPKQFGLTYRKIKNNREDRQELLAELQQFDTSNSPMHIKLMTIICQFFNDTTYIYYKYMELIDLYLKQTEPYAQDENNPHCALAYIFLAELMLKKISRMRLYNDESIKTEIKSFERYINKSLALNNNLGEIWLIFKEALSLDIDKSIPEIIYSKRWCEFPGKGSLDVQQLWKDWCQRSTG